MQAAPRKPKFAEALLLRLQDCELEAWAEPLLDHGIDGVRRAHVHAAVNARLLVIALEHPH